MTGPERGATIALVLRRKLALLAVVLGAGMLVSGEASRLALAPPSGSSLPARLGRVVLGGVVVALSPIGALVGCGGGGPRPTSATAVALAEATIDILAGAPVTATAGSEAIAPLAVGERRAITDVAVHVVLGTTGPVRLVLRQPEGLEVLLFEGDSSALPAAFDATTRPELRELWGRSPEGVWTLGVSAPRPAILRSWSLQLRVRD